MAINIGLGTKTNKNAFDIFNQHYNLIYLIIPEGTAIHKFILQ